jgi:Zn-dependent M28 family amino/carboxypeptidase
MNKRLALVMAALCCGSAGTSGCASDTQGARRPGGATLLDTGERPSFAPLGEAITLDGMMGHIEALQAIADAHGGNRAAGTSGGQATTDYAVSVFEAAGYAVTLETFEVPYTEELSPPTLAQEGPDIASYEVETDFVTMSGSGSGSVSAALVGVDLMLPPGDQESSSTSGCEADDFEGFPAGAVALIQRGTCTFIDKVTLAQAAGASAVLLFNEGQPGRTDPVLGALGTTVDVPVLGLSFEVGALLASLPDVTVSVSTSILSELRETHNVLAEPSWGDPERIVLLGGHIDSVPEGPGINDNGSGVALVLEAAEQAAGRRWSSRPRFGLWAAEELGLLGSWRHVTGLSELERDQHVAYLNVDMVASSNGAMFVYDGDFSGGEGDLAPEGSAEVEAMLLAALEGRGVDTFTTAFQPNSDHAPFLVAGVAVGGLFTGAGEIKTEGEAGAFGGEEGVAHDPCYHASCDDIGNLDTALFAQSGEAIGTVFEALATEGL